MSDKSVTIGSFEYRDDVLAELVERELDKIEKIEAQIDYSNPAIVYTLYIKLLERKMLKSPEGLVYLLCLQAFLDENQSKINKEIPPINVEDFDFSGKINTDEIKAEPSKNGKAAKEKNVGVYKIVIVFLILLIVGMLAISMASNSPTILNYRKQIEDEYASWEMDLVEKERQLNERERNLNGM